MEAACASISIDLLSYYDLFDTTIAHADDVGVFHGQYGNCHDSRLYRYKECALMLQARRLSETFVYDIISLMTASAITLSTSA